MTLPFHDAAFRFECEKSCNPAPVAHLGVDIPAPISARALAETGASLGACPCGGALLVLPSRSLTRMPAGPDVITPLLVRAEEP